MFMSNWINQVYSKSTVIFHQSIIFNCTSSLQVYSTGKVTVSSYSFYEPIFISINSDYNCSMFYSLIVI